MLRGRAIKRAGLSHHHAGVATATWLVEDSRNSPETNRGAFTTPPPLHGSERVRELSISYCEVLVEGGIFPVETLGANSSS